VPFIWNDPAVESKDLVNAGLCGTLDIANTILARAGLRGHNGMQGINLLPSIEGANTGHDSWVIEEHQRRGYMGFKNNFRARTLITRDFRLTLYEGVQWGELYDLANDPHELNNLWDDPQSRHRRHELTEALARQMMELADTSPLATHHGP
jgi:arylsulfatase A-like enzyme